MQVILLSAVIALFGLNQVYGHSGDRFGGIHETTPPEINREK